MAKKKKAAEEPQDNKKVFGDPVYGPEDDIYAHEKKERIKGEDGALDKGLDIPGSELDDQDEIIGEEDEENNYYSIGGDEHNDLEEEKE